MVIYPHALAGLWLLGGSFLRLFASDVLTHHNDPANGSKDGILWAAIPYKDDAWVEIVRGSMRAFRAETMELLWSTDANDPSDNFDFAKNVPPTVANGKVCLATFSDRLNVYGLHSPIAGIGQRPLPKVSKDPRKRGHHKGATGHTVHQHAPAK